MNDMKRGNEEKILAFHIKKEIKRSTNCITAHEKNNNDLIFTIILIKAKYKLNTFVIVIKPIQPGIS